MKKIIGSVLIATGLFLGNCASAENRGSDEKDIEDVTYDDVQGEPGKIKMVVQESSYGDSSCYVKKDKYFLTFMGGDISIYTADGILLKSYMRADNDREVYPDTFGSLYASEDCSVLYRNHISADDPYEKKPKYKSKVYLLDMEKLEIKKVLRFNHLIKGITSDNFVVMEKRTGGNSKGFSIQFQSVSEQASTNAEWPEAVFEASKGIEEYKMAFSPKKDLFAILYKKEDRGKSELYTEIYAKGTGWSLKNQIRFEKVNTDVYGDHLGSVQFSPDQKYLVSSIYSTDYDMSTGTDMPIPFASSLLIVDLTNGTKSETRNGVPIVKFLTTDDSIIAVGGDLDSVGASVASGKKLENGRALSIWNYDGTLVKRFLDSKAGYGIGRFDSKKSKFISFNKGNKFIEIRNNVGIIKRNISGVDSGSINLLSPNNKMFVQTMYGEEIQGKMRYGIKIWDRLDGRLICSLPGHGTEIVKMVFSKDSRFLLSGSGSEMTAGSADSSARVWDINTCKQIAKLPDTEEDNAGILIPVGFSDDNETFIFGVRGGTGGETHLFIASVKKSEWIKKIEKIGGARLVNNEIHTVQFQYPDGKPRNILTVYNMKGDLVREQPFQEEPETKNNKNELYNRYFASFVGGFYNQGRESIGNGVNFLSVGNDWLIYSDDGYFDSSPHIGDKVKMVSGLAPFNIDQFAAKFNRPDIILQRMGSTNQELIAHYKNQYLKRLKRMNLTEKDLLTDLHVPKTSVLNASQNDAVLNLKLKFSDEKFNLKKYNIYINDVPVFPNGGKDLTGKDSGDIQETVKLSSGENKVEVTCINEKGAESYRSVKYFTNSSRNTGNLYYLGFGVSNYKDASLNLQYAHKDVLDLKDLFESKLKKGFDSVNVKTFINEEVTAENIRAAKEFLNRTDVDDTVILFISGHGVHDKTKDPNYYYLTHNTDVNNLSGTAANFELVEDLLQGIPARKKLFLMDTCESGEVEESYEIQSTAMLNSKGLKARSIKGLTMSNAKKGKPARKYLFDKNRYIYNDLIRRSGAVVFSSSKGGELSYEDPKYENGLFTESMIEGLGNGAADADRDGQISVNELRDFVQKNVSNMTEGAQNPTIDRDNIFIKLKLPSGK